jgi:GH25 family lysozyme M1 (1,4-beta-N-acetylmuramidase)
VAQTGIQFAFAKASQGADASKSWYTDPTFARNWQGMKDAGVVRGAYHFIGLPLAATPKARWVEDLKRQIDHFLETVGPLDPGDLPPTLDLEDGDSPQRWKQLVASDRSGAIGIVRDLIQYATEQLNGTKPILYTGSFWWSLLGDPSEGEMPFGDYRLWFSQYPSVRKGGGQAESFEECTQRVPKRIPRVWGTKWSFWQFSSAGRLAPAIGGPVDLDVFNGDFEALRITSDRTG